MTHNEFFVCREQIESFPGELTNILGLPMDQSSFQAVTKLELRLEQSRKQRQKLKHELGKFDRQIFDEKTFDNIYLENIKKISQN